MAVIATVGNKEDFIVQLNGDYNVVFDELELADDAVAGEVIEVATGVYGIVAADGATGDMARVMVRGNPSTVNAQALVGFVALTHEAALAEAGIVVVNK